VVELARFIHENTQGLGCIDSAMDIGALETVDKIARVRETNGTGFISFASKYCSWHHPDAYPIYDSFVDKYLWQLQEQLRLQDNPPFTERFRHKQLKDYGKFCTIIDDLRKYYKLGRFSYRQIDKFLWSEGKRLQELKKTRTSTCRTAISSKRVS
jgi:hypothetical protein